MLTAKERWSPVASLTMASRLFKQPRNSLQGLPTTMAHAFQRPPLFREPGVNLLASIRAAVTGASESLRATRLAALRPGRVRLGACCSGALCVAGSCCASVQGGAWDSRQGLWRGPKLRPLEKRLSNAINHHKSLKSSRFEPPCPTSDHGSTRLVSDPPQKPSRETPWSSQAPWFDMSPAVSNSLGLHYDPWLIDRYMIYIYSSIYLL